MVGFRPYTLCLVVGNREAGTKYRQLALDRGDAIEAVLWNDTLSMWRDYDLRHGRQREEFYLSHITTVYTRCNGRTVNVTATDFLRKLLNSEDVREVTHSHLREICQ